MCDKKSAFKLERVVLGIIGQRKALYSNKNQKLPYNWTKKEEDKKKQRKGP